MNESSKGSPATWQPTTFLRFEEALDTSMGTARIFTDAGPAYIKAMGNRQGPHPLACELVATQLARWFGLPTFQFAIITIDATIDEIPFFRGGSASSGPAFITRAVTGHPWGGAAEELAGLVNASDIGRLVVFDTWLRNCDRHPPDLNTRRPNKDNVFLEDLSGDNRTRLIAMDHTHCFTCGGDLNHKVSQITHIKDERLFGLFPGFKPFVRQADVENAVDRLRNVSAEVVRPILETIPDEWEVNVESKNSMEKYVLHRAAFVSNTVLELIAKECWPDQLFDKR